MSTKERTTIAIIAHPDGDQDHPVVLMNGQKVALRRTLRLLDKFVGDKQVAVLASPAETVASYAKLVAGHFLADTTTCEGLLRDGGSGHVDDGCDCIDDYLDTNRFGLVVVLAGKDIAMGLADLLSHRVGKSVAEIPGVTHVYII